MLGIPIVGLYIAAGCEVNIGEKVAGGESLNLWTKNFDAVSFPYSDATTLYHFF